MRVKRTCISLERILILIKSREFACCKYFGWARKQDLLEEEIRYNGVSFPALCSRCWWLGFHLCVFLTFFFSVLSSLHATSVRLFSSGDYNLAWIASRIDLVVEVKVFVLELSEWTLHCWSNYIFLLKLIFIIPKIWLFYSLDLFCKIIELHKRYFPSRYGGKSREICACLDCQSNLSFGQDRK